jgi:steroid delta-isomerase-like uncharacterized protein
MNIPEPVKHYIDAWNRRDAAGIVACFTSDGVYSDAASGGILHGEAIATYAKALWAAFPDLHFETGRIAANGDGIFAVEWRIRGTNSGVFHGLPPTNRAVDVPGVDIVELNGAKLTSVTGYFDSRAVPEQLGLQVVVQPNNIGSFALGTSTSYQTGRTTKPGAFSITKLEARSEQEVQQIKELSRQIAIEMSKMEGFISLMGMTVGRRQMTVAAWESPENPRQMAYGGTHEQAMRKFFGPELAASGWTSVWIPDRINATWARCPTCARMLNIDKVGDRCSCGAAQPEPVAYW